MSCQAQIDSLIRRVSDIEDAECGCDACSVDYLANVILNGTSLEFTGEGLAFTGNIDLSSLGGNQDLASVLAQGNEATNLIRIGSNITNPNSRAISITLGSDIEIAFAGDLYIGSNINDLSDSDWGGGNLIVGSQHGIAQGLNLKNHLYANIILGVESEIGTDRTDYTTTTPVFIGNLFSGVSNEMYGGYGSGQIGLGLKSGSGGSTVVGINNRDLTQTNATYLNSTVNDYNPRFIVGTGFINPITPSSQTPQNGFVVMSDGVVTAPELSIDTINNPTIPTLASGTTDGVNTNQLIDSSQNFSGFLSKVKVGDTVSNTTDSTTATIVSIDSATTLTLDVDIMDTGENYVIYPANFAKRILITLEYFQANSGGLTPLSGDFTPTLVDTTPGATYTYNGITSVAKYYRIGDFVQISIRFEDVNSAGAAIGGFRMEGLPYAIDGAAVGDVGIFNGASGSFNTFTHLFVRGEDNNTYVDFWTQSGLDNEQDDFLRAGTMTSGTIEMSISYIAKPIVA